MLDRLTGMEVFVRAVREGSVSAAARGMRLSPAMATRHIDALEARLGTTLLRRSTRRLSLTEAGRHYLEACERLLPEVAEAEAAASARTVVIEGLLRLSAPMSFGTSYLAPLMPEFTRAHPRLTVEIGLNDRVVDLMEEGWDMTVRIGRLADSELVARLLAKATTVICAAPAYLAAHGTPRNVADLAGHDCLGYTLSSELATDHWTFAGKPPLQVPVRGSLRANNGEMLVAAAIAGQGIVYGPRFIAADAIEDGRLSVIELDHKLLDLGGIYAVYPRDRRPPAKVRAMIGFLAERLGAQEGRL